MNTIKLYFRFVAVHLKSAMIYKASFFFACFGNLLTTVNVYLGVVFLANRFGTVAGYTLPELSVCFGAVLMAFSLAECFGRGFDAFSHIMRSAMFDRLLVRPRSLTFQVLCQDLKPMAVARLLQAVLMLYMGVRYSNLSWTLGRGLTLSAMILCGAAVFFGVFLVGASLCFFTLEGLEVMNILTDGIREYGKYPFDVYGTGVLWALTLVVPMALVQYWPLQYLLGRGPGWYGLLPLGALLFLIPCAAIWRFGIRHYQSTGS